MKNYFIIHGSFGDSKEHWLPWLADKLRIKGETVYNLDFPIGLDKQNFDNWSKVLDEYKDKINKDTIFIGRSIAPIFIVKYLLKNNLKIKALYSVSGFNCFINIPDYDEVNKTFFLDEIKGFEKLCKKRVCYISKNDPYVPYYLLDMFTKNIKAKVVMNEDAGHYNTDSGYATFEELLNQL